MAKESPVFPTPPPEFWCDDGPMPRSVVIVDDDPAFLALAARILVDMGVEVLATAADAAEGLAAVQCAQPEAVLVDVGLPDRDGIDLAYELLELPWGPRVVLTSSDNEAFVALEGRNEGRRPPFIPKEELAGDALRRALRTA
jgi:DNA-binding NarL/FixJ family response regulator